MRRRSPPTVPEKHPGSHFPAATPHPHDLGSRVRTILHLHPDEVVARLALDPGPAMAAGEIAPEPRHADLQQAGGEIRRVAARVQRHLVLGRVPRHEIEQQLADGGGLGGLVPDEVEDLGVAGQGFVVEDDVVEEAVEAGVLQLGAGDAFGEDVEADDARVVAAGGVEAGVVEPVLEPVEDFEFREAVGELVGVGRGGGEGGEGGAEVRGVVHEELFVDDEGFGRVGAAHLDVDDFFVQIAGRGGLVLGGIFGGMGD